MKKLNEAELFINKLNACNEPILTKEGTKHAIEIIDQQNKEIKRLNNIIKEAIEYLKDNACYNDMGNFNDDLDYDKCGDLLEILDKGE